MLSDDEKKIIENIVVASLNKAEKHWKNGGSQLQLEAATEDDTAIFSEALRKKDESEPSKIPGHPIVQEKDTVIDEFIALVADMRDSSKHLMNEISQKTSSVTRLERVYYETSALLPAIAQTIKFKNVNVTEYF